MVSKTTARMLGRTAAASRYRSVGGVIAIVATGGAAFFSGRASAQELEEVVVTAQRREQSLQDVGVSVRALSSEELRSLNVTSAPDIASGMAGVTFDAATGGTAGANLGIRGVVQSEYSAHQESPNSIYIDEVYLASPLSAAFPIYDLERVELLRGPQGTLFGRASSGGLVSFITAKPGDVAEGYFEAGYGRFNQRYLEAAFGGPLSDRVRGRVAGRYAQADGWFENRAPSGADSRGTEAWGVRAQVETDLTDTLLARLSVTHDESPRHREGVYKVFSSVLLPNGDTALLPADVDAYGTGPGNDLYGYRDPIEDKHAGEFNDFGFFENQRTSPTLYLTWARDAITLTSITNYTKFTYLYAEDCDGSPLNNCRASSDQDLKQWSQEIRANGQVDQLTWTAGVFFLNVDQRIAQNFDIPAAAGTAFAFSGVNPFEQELTSYAAFGQLEYQFTPQWRGTLGLRYTRDEKSFDSQFLLLELGSAFGGAGVNDPPLLTYDFREGTVGDAADATEDMVSGKIQIDYLPREDVLVYASVSRGERGPGFSANFGGSLSLEDTPFDSDAVLAYEVGTKLTGDRTRLNVALFYYDYKDFQSPEYRGFNAFVQNGDTTFEGGEVEFTWAPLTGLTVDLGVAYLDAVTKDYSTQTRGIRDQVPTNVPEWSGNGAVRQVWPAGPGDLTLQWDFNYLDERFNSANNLRGNLLDSSFVHNARIGYGFRDAGWELAAFVRNISDTDRITTAYDLTTALGQIARVYAPPRTWGMSVRKSF